MGKKKNRREKPADKSRADQARTTQSNSSPIAQNISRRNFLATASATAGAMSGAAITASPLALGAEKSTHHDWDSETDVLVVGTGAAGSCAALFAHRAGASVTIIEKAAFYGGTTLKSQGAYWIPNNRLMRDRGLVDNKADALNYMARLSFPTLHNPAAPQLGLPLEDYQLLEAFYDHGSRVLDDLATMDALQSTFFKSAAGEDFPDYYSHLPENKASIGRILLPVSNAGAPGMGDELIRQLQKAVNDRNIPVLFNQRASKLLQSERGEVIGLQITNVDGGVKNIRVHKGVVFGTGGFIHNQQMRLNYLRGPVYGGCTMPTAEGDFVTIGSAAGAKLGNMNHAWWAQILFEQAVQNSAVPMNVFIPPGDSMILVNRYGKRYVNEKFVYNERSQSHFHWDPVRAEYPNLLSFMIYDQQVAENNSGIWPIPDIASVASTPYVISGGTLAELQSAITDRLASLAEHSGGATLDPQFATTLENTIEAFNGFAKQGADPDYHRGEVASELFFHGFYTAPGHRNEYPNPTMQPLADRGPYYAIILAAGVLDTKGGPRINTHAQVLDNFGQPIPGLYGAGNCIASPAGQAYWSAGGTIAPAMVFGALAGEHVSRL